MFQVESVEEESRQDIIGLAGLCGCQWGGSRRKRSCARLRTVSEPRGTKLQALMAYLWAGPPAHALGPTCSMTRGTRREPPRC